MLRVIVNLVLLFVLAYAGVTIWYGRLEEKLQVMPETGATAVVQKEEEKTEILRKPDDYTIIVDRNIFQAGIAEAEEETVAAAPEELEPTKLKLSLMGTVSGKERDARAIIADDLKKQQDIYQVGDTIQGSLIKAIDRGRVILVVNGADEVLTLADREGGGPAYEPSPADYYEEPVEIQDVPVTVDQPEPVQEAVEMQEMPEAVDLPADAGFPEPTEQVGPEPQVRSSPPVRPRPYRRPARVNMNPGALNEPGIDETMTPDEARLE